MSKWEHIFIVASALLALAFGVGITVMLTTGIFSDAIISALTADLVGVTAYYAFTTQSLVQSTNRGVEVANQQVQIMRNAQLNEAVPVVQLNNQITLYPISVDMHILWRNIGKGPALNFRCWIEDPEHPEFRGKDFLINRSAVGIDTDFSQQSFYIAIPDYKLGIGYIRAQYESVFGVTYESCLMFPTNVSPQLEWGEVKNKQDIIRL